MTARRRLLAAASATFALASLTACEKPAPIVTVVSGGESVYTEAAAFCFEEGQTLQSGGCATRAGQVPRLEVRQGERIGIDVDKELADGAWLVTLTDQARPEQPLFTSEVQRENHYYTLDLPDLPRETTVTLQVQALTEDGEPGQGSWEFLLRPRSA